MFVFHLFFQKHFRIPEHFGSKILVKRSFKVIYLEAFLEGGGHALVDSPININSNIKKEEGGRQSGKKVNGIF